MVRSGEDQPARPLRRDAERNRQRILRAAGEVFTARGLQATLDDVARQAGVGVGTVYRRFPDKDSLIEALFEERVQAVAELAEKALAEPDSWDGLVSFLREACELMAGDHGLREIVMFGTYGRDRVELGKARMQPLVTRLVQRAQRDGKVRADLEPTDMLFMEFMLRDMPPEPWPPPPPPLAKASLADNEATVIAKAATVAVRMDFMVMFVSDPSGRDHRRR